MNKLKGNFDYLKEEYNRREKSCRDIVSKDENLVVLYDLESGYPYVATKEYQKQLLEVFEFCRPKLYDKFKGQILVFGTGNTNENYKEFEELFYKIKNNE